MNQKIGRIAVITGSRAEYYLLQPVITKLEKITAISLEVLVSGDHLNNRNDDSLQDIQNSVSAPIHLLPIEVKTLLQVMFALKYHKS